MSTTVAILLVAVAAILVSLYVKFRGQRIVTCPETQKPVGTKINAALAAGTWLVTRPRFVVSACTRWPERAGCDQACAPQIEAAPEETLVRNIVTRWYAERTCIYCAKPIRDLGGAVVPALRNADGELQEWKDVRAEELPSALERSVAVCAACELAEDFRKRFPKRVLDNPQARPARHMEIAAASEAVY